LNVPGDLNSDRSEPAKPGPPGLAITNSHGFTDDLNYETATNAMQASYRPGHELPFAL
jgi:hypothetical protein